MTSPITFTFSRDDRVGAFIEHFTDLVPLLRVYGIHPINDADRTLAECCRDLRLDPLPVLTDVAVNAQSPAWSDDDTDWSGASIEELIDHIVVAHHGTLLGELPRLRHLIRTIAATTPEAAVVAERFTAVMDHLLDHLRHEEAVVFPMCIDLDHHLLHADHPDRQLLIAAIRIMEHGHHALENEVDWLQNTLTDMAVPAALAQPLTALRLGFGRLRQDLERHHGMEEEYLVPAVLHIHEVLRTGLDRKLQHPRRRSTS